MGGFLLGLFLFISQIGLSLEGYQSQYVATEQGQMHYYHIEGSGSLPPIVLLHGIGMQAADLYLVYRHFRTTHQAIIAVDLPAHGLSEYPINKMNIKEIETNFYQGLDQILAKTQPALLFGNSLGGLHALMYARHRPDNLAGLILVSPAGASLTAPQYQELQHIFLHESTQEPQALLRRLYNQIPPYSDTAETLVKARFETPQLQAYMAKLQPDLFLSPAALSEIKLPTLLIWGQQDRVLNGHLAYFKAHMPAHFELKEPAHFTHVPYIEADMDKELAQMIVNWTSARFRP